MAELTFVATAGVLVRGAVRRALTAYAWNHGYAIDIKEEKGLLTSLMRVTYHLPEDCVAPVRQELTDWLRQVGAYDDTKAHA